MSLTLSRGKPNNPDPDYSGSNPSAPSAGEDRIPPDKSPDEIMREMDKEELLRRFILFFKESRDHFKESRQETAECYDFVGGNQWDDEDRKILSDQGRPAVTFNRVQPFVDGVSGLEIGNRQTTQYLPRTVGDSGVSELLTGAAQWVRDECEADFEESEMFRDAVICGYGCTQTRLSYDEDPEGQIVIERVDPLEMYPDPSSRKPNFSDARFVMRVKDIPVETAEEMFPKFDAYDLHARWAEDEPAAERQPHNARLAPYYRIDQAGEVNRERMQARLVEVEWWDYEKVFRTQVPGTGKMVQLSAKDAGRYRVMARLSGFTPQLVNARRKRYYKAICGNVILAMSRGPDEGGFTYKFITAKRDRNMSTWYGLVRAMRDPQMWANKFMSQSLHIVNTNAKGGLLAETDVFVDIDEARDAWAEADSIIELNPGGLNKVKQKDIPQFPVQINNMMAAALEAIPATAGINMEMIAQQTNDQSGVLEMQRKQQGMSVLAYIFNAKRRYQKEQGRLLLWMITTFISDGRLIRIGGPESAQYVPLVHQPGLAEYDIVVDDAPTSPNMKERVWAMIVQMFPMLRSLNLPPQALLEFMRYAPFPASMISKLQQMAQQQVQNPPPAQQAQIQLAQAKVQAAQAQAAHAGAKTQQVSAQMVQEQAKAQHAQVEAQMMPVQVQGDLNEQQAKIDLLKAQAVQALGAGVNQFQNAGIAPAQAAQEARMLEAQFSHQQSMDQATHALEVMKATAPQPAPTPGGTNVPPSGQPSGQSQPGAATMPPPPPPGPGGSPGMQQAFLSHAMGPMMTPPAPGPMPQQPGPPGGLPFGAPQP